MHDEKYLYDNSYMENIVENLKAAHSLSPLAMFRTKSLILHGDYPLGNDDDSDTTTSTSS